jgi:putative redox protein
LAGTKIHAQLASPNYKTEIMANGHALVADEPADLGGADAGPSPFALVLSGLSACTAITLKMYAERKGFTLEGLSVDLALHAGEPKRKIERVIAVRGALAEAQVSRMREIAERTPVTLALKDGFEINTTLTNG